MLSAFLEANDIADLKERLATAHPEDQEHCGIICAPSDHWLAEAEEIRSELGVPPLKKDPIG